MNDAQAWTAIGGLLAVLCAFIGLIVRLLGITLGSRLGTIDVRFESLDLRFASIDARFASMDARFETFENKMGAGFASLERRVDGLDRDVAAITRRLLDGQ